MAFGIFRIDDETMDNVNFRKVVYTAKEMQLVVMSLKPDEEIGMEVHEHVDQFFRIEKGTALFVLGNIGYHVKEGGAVIVDRGTCHNVINIGTGMLKLYTIYSPPNHPPNRLQLRKPAEKPSKACRGQ